MTPWVAVHGTHDDPLSPRSWACPTGPLPEFFARHGLVLREPPFLWSGGLDGVPFDRGRDWDGGAAALSYYLEPIPYADRRLVAHSHGGAVALRAAARGTTLRSLVTVGTPVRKDIREAGRLALERGAIGTWLHIHDARWDWLQRAGMLFDGRLWGATAFELPGMVDCPVPGIGHSKVLCDARAIRLWQSEGWLDALRGRDDVDLVA